jgi:hypothetical protein
MTLAIKISNIYLSILLINSVFCPLILPRFMIYSAPPPTRTLNIRYYSTNSVRLLLGSPDRSPPWRPPHRVPQEPPARPATSHVPPTVDRYGLPHRPNTKRSNCERCFSSSRSHLPRSFPAARITHLVGATMVSSPPLLSPPFESPVHVRAMAIGELASYACLCWAESWYVISHAPVGA